MTDEDTRDAAMRAEYEALPEPIRCSISFKEWCWLPADQRATLEADLCEPEWI